MRKKIVERCEVEYKMDGAVIPMVFSYKYFDCVVDEHVELKAMVEEKAVAGRRALSAWLNRCKTEAGDVGVARHFQVTEGFLGCIQQCRVVLKSGVA